MQDFYSRVLGFPITDEGLLGTQRLRGYRSNRSCNSYTNFQGAAFWYVMEVQEAFDYLRPARGLCRIAACGVLGARYGVSQPRSGFVEEFPHVLRLGARLLFNTVISRVNSDSAGKARKTPFSSTIPFEFRGDAVS